MTYVTNSPAETEALGQRLAETLQPGDVIAYTGDLGAGKTAFTRGLARGLGITERITSPTFTIVNEYLGGRLPLFHFDMYRLKNLDEAFDIGIEDYLFCGAVCFIEWPERIEDILPDDTVTVHITVNDDDSRTLTIDSRD